VRGQVFICCKTHGRRSTYDQFYGSHKVSDNAQLAAQADAHIQTDSIASQTKSFSKLRKPYKARKKAVRELLLEQSYQNTLLNCHHSYSSSTSLISFFQFGASHMLICSQSVVNGWHDMAPPITLYGRLLPKIGQQLHTMVIAVVQYHLAERVANNVVAYELEAIDRFCATRGFKFKQASLFLFMI
jgi:hypothetical protein